MESSKTEQQNIVLTADDFYEFISASDDEQLNVLLAHAERNSKAVDERKRNDRPDA